MAKKTKETAPDTGVTNSAESLVDGAVAALRAEKLDDAQHRNRRIALKKLERARDLLAARPGVRVV